MGQAGAALGSACSLWAETSADSGIDVDFEPCSLSGEYFDHSRKPGRRIDPGVVDIDAVAPGGKRCPVVAVRLNLDLEQRAPAILIENNHLS